MKTDFAKAWIQLGAEELEILTAEVKESIAIGDEHQKLKKRLTAAEYWNIKRNRKIFGRRKYLTDQDLEAS